MIIQATCTVRLPNYRYPFVMPSRTDPALAASELRVVMGHLVRRLRQEHGFPLSHGAVLGRLDRGGPQSVSDLAAAERVRPQSMAQTVSDLEGDGLVSRRPDPSDGRRALVELTDAGSMALTADRRRRDGWLARGIEDLDDAERAVLSEAIDLLRRLSES
jgi:DNA-binding MarR family transcriptional regulator